MKKKKIEKNKINGKLFAIVGNIIEMEE